ncbi:hypothetical protein JIG36_31540 [Actinoplanes sp. LDG1-06]|uniref:Uncharacterized protein n=1 Tax=Paractinoplanes ovalisporus TaxID=2810368 RepID=A0ABS2AJS5_9ACTN|nr:hypothetical protein [Actinoplanes ovalisporus]MBM2620056.1 hypothetical protein [Actinoplanes ovalisporus]
MDGSITPWWKQVDEAAQLVASSVNAAAARAERDGAYQPPPGQPEPKRRRKAGSLRHLAEVIRTHRLAPGVSVDKDIVAGVLAGDLRHITDKTSVVAVARASHLIANRPFGDEDAKRLEVAVDRVAALVAQARESDEKAPAMVPAPRPGATVDTIEPPAAPTIDAYFTTRPPQRPGRRRRWLVAGSAVVLLAAAGGVTAYTLMPSADEDCLLGAAPGDIIGVSTQLFDDKEATRLNPTLDFDEMNGSARYARHEGRTYYWGRAGSDDHVPTAGGARVRWSTPDGTWRSCEVALPREERGYVHTPAVPTTINGQAVTIQVCLWRDEPRRESCLPEIATG